LNSSAPFAIEFGSLIGRQSVRRADRAAGSAREHQGSLQFTSLGIERDESVDIVGIGRRARGKLVQLIGDSDQPGHD
jgi:hypothetical protein